MLAVLLGVAAVLMFAQASARIAALLPRMPAPRLPAGLQRRLGGLLAAPTGLRGVALGLMLSALPCGLLYGALAGAAATGSVLGGVLAMAPSSLGTMPALMGVALLGRFFGRRAGPGMRMAGAALFALNGVMLAAMALRRSPPDGGGPRRRDFARCEANRMPDVTTGQSVETRRSWIIAVTVVTMSRLWPPVAPLTVVIGWRRSPSTLGSGRCAAGASPRRSPIWARASAAVPVRVAGGAHRPACQSR